MSPNSCWLWSLQSSSKSTWTRRLPGLARAVYGRRKSVNKCYDNHDIHYHFNPDHFYHPTSMIIMAIGRWSPCVWSRSDQTTESDKRWLLLAAWRNTFDYQDWHGNCDYHHSVKDYKRVLPPNFRKSSSRRRWCCSKSSVPSVKLMMSSVPSVPSVPSDKLMMFSFWS